MKRCVVLYKDMGHRLVSDGHAGYILGSFKYGHLKLLPLKKKRRYLLCTDIKIVFRFDNAVVCSAHKRGLLNLSAIERPQAASSKSTLTARCSVCMMKKTGVSSSGKPQDGASTEALCLKRVCSLYG